MANKTQPHDRDVAEFLDAIEHPTRRQDAHDLNQMF